MNDKNVIQSSRPQEINLHPPDHQRNGTVAVTPDGHSDRPKPLGSCSFHELQKIRIEHDALRIGVLQVHSKGHLMHGASPKTRPHRSAQCRPAIYMLTMLAIVCQIGCDRHQSSAQRPVALGAVLPLTGPIAQYGTYMRQGIELAYDDAVASGLIDKRKVKVVFEDGAVDPSKSVTAFQKLITTENLVAVIPATSAVTLAMKPITNRQQIVMINASAISTEINDADDYVFSVIPDADFEGAFLAEHAASEQHKHAAVIYRNDASGAAFLAAFTRRFEQLGGNVVYSDAHPPNTSDFRPYLDRLAGHSDIDVVFVASFGPEVAAFVRQMKQQGMTLAVIGYTTCYSPKLLEIAGQAAEGIEFSAPAFSADVNAPTMAALRKKVKERFGQNDVDYYIASHYDAAMLVFRAIAAGHTDGASIKRYFADQREYDGMTGHITFTSNGACTIPFKMYTVVRGAFVPLASSATQPATEKP